jgi:peptidoglycan hydrolase CwlO-like protein
MKKRLKQRLKIIVCVATALAITITSLPTLASEEELIQTADELQVRLDSLDQELLAISEEIEDTELRIEIVHAEVIRTEQNLEVATADEARQFDDMKIRIRHIYEMSTGSLLEFLLSSESISDFLNRAEFVQTINNHDREMLNLLVATQQEIQEKRDTLVAQEVSLRDLGEELEEQRTHLTAQAAATATDLDAFLADLEWLRAEERARVIEEANLIASNQPPIEVPPTPPTTPENPPDNSAGNEDNNNNGSSDGEGNATPQPPVYAAAGETVLFAAILEAEAH